MSVITVNKKAIKADRDITCFKVYAITRVNKKRRLVSPFQDELVELDKGFHKAKFENPYLKDAWDKSKEGYLEVYKSGGSEIYKKYFPEEYKVDEGFVHAYKDLINCPKIKNIYLDFYKRSKFNIIGIVTFMCKVPKGTYYYEDDDTICARKLKIVKFIKEPYE